MKILLTQEGADALREFADMIPKAINDIHECSERLYYTYNAVADSVGPHAEDFLEMLDNTRRLQREYEDSIKELSYMLLCTAEKIESYAHYGVATGGAILTETKDIRRRYAQEVNNRLNHKATNTFVQELYEEYQSNIRIVDYDYMGTPFYNSISNGIKLNAMADLHNPVGTLSTYFHEVGHMIDDYAGNGHTWLSSDQRYGVCLRNDVEAYVNKIILEKHCSKEDAYDIISDEISGVWSANVSDIFGALTGCQCQGDWGHSRGYWNDDPSRIEKEAFANMFESSIGCQEKVDCMRKYFPRAYSRFEELIRSV